MASTLQFWNIAPAPGACPFAQRAWITLVEKKIKYKTHIADHTAKPKEFTALYQEVWPDPKVSAKVPTIIDVDGTKLTESAIVVEYLEARYKQEGLQLVPDDAAAAAKARLFGEVFQSAVFRAAYTSFQAKTKAQVTEAGNALKDGITTVDKYLTLHGKAGGPFLLGNAYSIAEVNTAPFLSTISVLLPAYRGFDLINEAESAGAQRFAEWAKAVLDRPSTKETSLPADITISSKKQYIAEVEA